MESLQGNSLSRRNKLYLNISENLTENQVKSLQHLLITDHHIAKGKIEKKTPHEIFNMLEADGKIGEGNLGLLNELLTALKETRLAKEVEDMEMAQNISWLHSKLGFKVEELKPKAGGKPVKGSSIPLILPNDLKYNAATGGVEKKKDAERTSLQVVPEASDLLEGIEEPVSVLAICGPCRTGKSYILSRLLGTADAFALGHRMDPQTFGIWMGTKVLRGKDFTIVLLDTEGIDAVGASASQDASILVLTILLSSHLIYNSQNVPHKGDLEKMQCFIKLATGVTVKQGSPTDVADFPEFFPDFLWLLRDVTLQMVDDNGTEMDPTEYLKAKVLKRDGKAFEESTSDKVGRAILTFFPSVECTKLERPSGDTEVMNNIVQHTDKLNPKFNKGVNALTERLLEKSRAKRAYNKTSTVSGVALSIMAKQYVAAVNDPNSIPALDNTWKHTVELMQGRAITDVVEEYNRQMQAQVATATNNWQDPLEESPQNEVNPNPTTLEHGSHTRNPPSQPTLMDLHNEVFKKVKAMFLEKVGHFGVGSEEGNDEIGQMEKRLVQREERTVEYVTCTEDGTSRKQNRFVVTGGELFQYVQKNKDLSRVFCKRLFERLLGPISKRVESPAADYDLQQFEEELDNARQLYKEQARGPEKWIVLQEMTPNIDKLKANFEKIVYQRRIMQVEQRVHEAELRATELEGEMTKLIQQAQDMEQNRLENMQQMDRLLQTYQNEIRQLKHQMEEQKEDALRTIQGLQAEHMEQQVKFERDRYERDMSRFGRVVEQMEKQLADIQRQMEELKKQPPRPPTPTPPPPPPPPPPKEQKCTIL